MPQTVYHTARLHWTDRKGVYHMRQGNARHLAEKLEKLRCPARLYLMNDGRFDGEKIGGCERAEGLSDKRIKWNYWYDKDALVAGTEPTPQEIRQERLREILAARQAEFERQNS
jgi:hypothetical protein